MLSKTSEILRESLLTFRGNIINNRRNVLFYCLSLNIYVQHTHVSKSSTSKKLRHRSKIFYRVLITVKRTLYVYINMTKLNNFYKHSPSYAKFSHVCNENTRKTYPRVHVNLTGRTVTNITSRKQI